MTPVGWVLVAAALLLVGPPEPGPERIRALRSDRRLRRRAADVHRRRRRRSAGSGPALVRVVAGTVGAPLVLGVGVRFGVALGVAAAAAAVTGARFGVDLVRTRAANARHRDLLGAVRVLVAEVEAGSGAAAALSSAARAGPLVAPALEAAAGVASAGGSAGEALASASDVDLRRVGLAWQVGDDAGAPRAEVLRRVADDLTAADEQRRAVGVALAGPRASAAVLAGLPVLGVGLGLAMEADPVGVLTSSGAGRGLACAGVLLDLAGLWWMRRLILGAQR